MLRRRKFEALVLVLMLVVAVIPDTCGLMMLFVRHPSAQVPYSAGLVERNPWPLPKSDDNLRARTLSGTDWEVYVVLAEVLGRGYNEPLAEVASECPQACATAAVHSIPETGLLRPEGQSDVAYLPDVKTVEEQQERARKLLELCSIGSGLDPDNCFFDLLAAHALFGLHRDEEALECLRIAARKPNYNSYVTRNVFSVAHYYQAMGLPRLEALHTASRDVQHHHLSALRSVGKLVNSNARKSLDEGKSLRAEEMLMVLTTIGNTVGRHSRYGPEDAQLLSGVALTDGRESERIMSGQRMRMEYALAHEWAFFGRGLVFAVTDTALLALRMAVGALILTGVLWLLLRALRVRESSICPPSLLWKTGLALLVPLAYLTTHVLSQVGDFLPTHGRMLIDGRSMELPGMIGVRVPMLSALILVGLGASVSARREGSPSGLVCFLTTLKRGAALTAKVLLVTSLVLLIIQLPMRQSETSRLQMELSDFGQAVDDWHQGQHEGGGR